MPPARKLTWLVLLLAACVRRGSGTARSERRAVHDVHEVELDGQGELHIAQDGTESLRIEADDNLLSLLTSDVENGRLHLGTRGTLWPKAPIRYTLSVKDLRAIYVYGAATVQASGLDADSFAAEANGAAHLTLSGRVQRERIVINGAGDCNSGALRTAAATVNLSGAGNATVNASDSLDVVINGGGTVTYLGSPRIEQHVNGFGKVVAGG